MSKKPNICPDLSTREARAKLIPSCYWYPIIPKEVYLGYSSVWLVKIYIGAGKYDYSVIGHADDGGLSKELCFSFEQAISAVERYFQKITLRKGRPWLEEAPIREEKAIKAKEKQRRKNQHRTAVVKAAFELGLAKPLSLRGKLAEIPAKEQALLRVRHDADVYAAIKELRPDLILTLPEYDDD